MQNFEKFTIYVNVGGIEFTNFHDKILYMKRRFSQTAVMIKVIYNVYF
jgi:hypothetical protein